MTIRSEQIYGIDINFQGLGFTDDEYDEGISWDDPVIAKVREFAYENDLVPIMSNDAWDGGMTSLVIGVPLWKVREIKDSEMKCIEKAKALFEEKAKDGLFEKLLEATGHTKRKEPDLHMMVEER